MPRDWWSCSRCGYRTPMCSCPADALADRDRHIAWNHPGELFASWQLATSHYVFPVDREDL